MSGNGGNLHSLRDLPGTYEKSGLGVASMVTALALVIVIVLGRFEREVIEG